MIAYFLTYLLLYAALSVFAVMYAERNSAVYWSDAAAPILVFLFWFCIVATGYGHQSLSHIIEAPIALLASFILLNLRVFVIDCYKKNYKINSYIMLGISLLIVVLLRTFMPFLPE